MAIELILFLSCVLISLAGLVSLLCSVCIDYLYVLRQVLAVAGRIRIALLRMKIHSGLFLIFEWCCLVASIHLFIREVILYVTIVIQTTIFFVSSAHVEIV